MLRARVGRRLLEAAAVAALLGGCAAPPPEADSPDNALRHPRRPPALVDRGGWAGLRQALDRSLAWLEARPAGEAYRFGPRLVEAAGLAGALAGLRGKLEEDPSPEELASWVRQRFEALESRAEKVLVTGYYEPCIDASLEARAGYGVPVYGPPPDRILVPLGRFGDRFEKTELVGRLEGNRLVPYWDRAQIRAARPLAGRGLEIAWARDPVDLFVVEVQGSGTLLLPDRSQRRIGYAGSNGRPYRSIGKLLIDEGHVARDRMSMQAIRAWLEAHPDQVERVLDYNPSVVFFELREGPALGSLGVPVTAGRSIATDRRLYPPAALAFLETGLPLTPGTPGREAPALARFVLNQDTGGAIRGTDRVDLFWGRGAQAERLAGHMREPGRLYFLVPTP